MAVYLIHFDKPFGHARHYLGYSKATNASRYRLRERLRHHARGTGSKIMRAVSASGIGWQVVHVWWNEGQSFERRMKNRGGLARCCPVCKGNKPRLRASYWRWEPKGS